MNEVHRRWHLGFPQAAWGGVGVGEQEKSVVWCHPCPPRTEGRREGSAFASFSVNGVEVQYC